MSSMDDDLQPRLRKENVPAYFCKNSSFSSSLPIAVNLMTSVPNNPANDPLYGGTH